VDDDELELSVLKFMLATNGYRVVCAASAAEATAVFAAEPVDLVTVSGKLPGTGAALVEQLKGIKPYVGMILFSDPGSDGGAFADAVICRRSCPTVDLLERIKIMSERKRGSRKRAQQVAAPELSTVST